MQRSHSQTGALVIFLVLLGTLALLAPSPGGSSRTPPSGVAASNLADQGVEIADPLVQAALVHGAVQQIPINLGNEPLRRRAALTARQAETQVCQRLNAALPDGIDVIDVTELEGTSGGASPGAGTTFGHLEASEWEVVLPGVEPAVAGLAVAAFLARDEAPVERLTDKGVRRLDARAAVLEMYVSEHAAAIGNEDCAILRMVVLHTAPAVRPEDVVTALRGQDGIAPSSPPMTTRLAQGPRALLAGKGTS